MTKAITRTELVSLEELLRKVSETSPSVAVVRNAEDGLRMVATIYQCWDALRAALDYVEGKDKSSKVLTRAIIRETLGLEDE